MITIRKDTGHEDASCSGFSSLISVWSFKKFPLGNVLNER
jgi:hypothetical protein